MLTPFTVKALQDAGYPPAYIEALSLLAFLTSPTGVDYIRRTVDETGQLIDRALTPPDTRPA